jgi:hypothetical protein
MGGAGAARANGRIGNSKHGAHLYSRDPFALRSVRPATADTDATFVSRTVAELRRSPAPNQWPQSQRNSPGLLARAALQAIACARNVPNARPVHTGRGGRAREGL